MTRRQLSPVLRHLRRLVRPPVQDGVSDAQLLERFVVQNDEAALELLLWRHGPMVWALCRRILPNFHEAEDAFQAAMLVLARKAGSINKKRSLASWLYKVAFRIALRARADSSRRFNFEKQVERWPAREVDFSPDNGCTELRPLIDEGLNELPEKYRAPVLLCYLQNKTNEEAARLLRWPIGTVKTRLAKARELLGRWLRRRGVILSVAGLPSALMPPASQAMMPAGLLSATLKSAVLVSAGSIGAAAISIRTLLLVEGTMKAMFWTKMKIVTAVILFAGVAGSGAGMVSYYSWAAGGDAQSVSTSGQVTPKASTQKLQPGPADDELRAAQADLLMRENDLGEAESLLERAKARLQVGKKRVEELQKKLPARRPFDPKEPVAFIFDMPITREQLADYLIAQYGADKLEQLVNKLIIERACRDKGVSVTDEEIEAAVKEDAKAMGCNGLDAFENLLKKLHHRSLLEWRRDVVKPRLCMNKLARLRVSASDEDIQQAFQRAYGEKVLCQITWLKAHDDASQYGLVATIGKGPEEFERFIKEHSTKKLSDVANQLDPVGRHENAYQIVEEAGLRLRPGETHVVETQEGTITIKCLQRVPPDSAVKLEDVRAQLIDQVLAMKTQQEIPKLFEELRKQAQPRMLLKK